MLMAYDVLLVAAIKDSDKATVIARRLRALKFRVRFDASRNHTTPSSRDLGDCNKAASVLVLWSKAACDTSSADSDWVHAMAHLARSRDGALVQASLDDTVPDDPFEKDQRYDLTDLTSRKTPEGVYSLVERLGQRDGRRGLRDWMMLSASDEAGKQAWRDEHPNDPLSHTIQRSAAAGQTPRPIRAGTAAAASAAATARLVDASKGHGIELNPPTPERDFYPDRSSGSGWAMLVPVLIGVAGMMAAGWFYRTSPVQTGSSGGPGTIRNVVKSCPAGQVPRSLLHGSILLQQETDEPAEE
jgi:hypothetical protein